MHLAGFAVGPGRNPGIALWRHVQPFAASLMRTHPFVAAMLGFGVWGLAHAAAPAQSLKAWLCF